MMGIKDKCPGFILIKSFKKVRVVPSVEVLTNGDDYWMYYLCFSEMLYLFPLKEKLY